MGIGGVISLERSWGKSPTILRYLKLKIANSEPLYARRVTQNKQIATSKDAMKYYQPEEKFCFETFFLFLPFKKQRN